MSKYFSIKEFTKSKIAQQNGIKNIPDTEIVKNLERLALELLDPVRVFLKRPVHINSGYRSVELNAAIGGTENSAHTLGCAADLVADQAEQLAILRFLADKDILFDQAIIYPNRGFIHLSLMPKGNRREFLISKIKGQYEKIFV